MFTESQLEKYADVLMWGLDTSRINRFKKHEIVLIRYNIPSIRLAEKVYDRLLDRGLNPVHRVMPSWVMERSFYKRADHQQLIFRPPGDEELYNNLNGSVYIIAPESMTHLSDIDPKKIAKAAVARKYIHDILDKREEEGVFGWTLGAFPTETQAQHANISLEEYTQQIVKACFLNKPSPVAQWKTIHTNAQSIKKWLNSMNVKKFHIESEHIDLEITPGENRRWVGISGHNIPSFELFISPDWRGTSGIYYANQPSYRSGNYVEGVQLTFKKGKAVNISAKTGELFVKKQLSMDKGANKVGEFSLTDKRFSKIDRFMANTLFDENYGGKFGNCHIAVGSSYSDTYNGNPKDLSKELKEKLGFNDSALHWDLVNTEPKCVTAHLTNGKTTVIYENGQFLY